MVGVKASSLEDATQSFPSFQVEATEGPQEEDSPPGSLPSVSKMVWDEGQEALREGCGG
jgi:hypothetical protein